MDNLEFTKDWFSAHHILWKDILATQKPQRILEIGSFEGRSTCYMIEQCSEYTNTTIFCVDSWAGGVEHSGIDFVKVERTFEKNITTAVNTPLKHHVTVVKMKGLSYTQLAKLMCDNELFDMIYIDGSHMPTDVLLDATMSFALLRVGGIMIFDDYRRTHQPELEHPQIAIDAFLKVYANKMKPIQFNVDGKLLEDDKLYQKYLIKVAP